MVEATLNLNKVFNQKISVFKLQYVKPLKG